MLQGPVFPGAREDASRLSMVSHGGSQTADPTALNWPSASPSPAARQDDEQRRRGRQAWGGFS